MCSHGFVGITRAGDWLWGTWVSVARRYDGGYGRCATREEAFAKIQHYADDCRAKEVAEVLIRMAHAEERRR